MVAQSIVHTTGVNWELVAAVVTCVVTTMTLVFGFFAKLVGNQITASIDKFRIQVVNQLDHRLTTVEVKINTLMQRKHHDSDDV